MDVKTDKELKPGHSLKRAPPTAIQFQNFLELSEQNNDLLRKCYPDK